MLSKIKQIGTTLAGLGILVWGLISATKAVKASGRKEQADKQTLVNAQSNAEVSEVKVAVRKKGGKTILRNYNKR